MLVLSRRIGERIVIDGGIVIEVCEATEGRVSLGIDAPRDVRVDREEVADRKAREARDQAGEYVHREE